MTVLLLVGWLFLVAAFCTLGGACALASLLRGGGQTAAGCRSRTLRARPDHRLPGSRAGPANTAAHTRPARKRSGIVSRDAHLKALQQRFVDGRLSVEQYEREIDRLLGLAS